MAVIHCKSLEEAKKEIEARTNVPRSFYVYVNGEKVAYIDNYPQAIGYVFYVQDDEVESKIGPVSNVEERIKKVADYLALEEVDGDYVVSSKQKVSTKLIDKVVGREVRTTYKNEKGEVKREKKKFEGEWKDWASFVTSINQLLAESKEKEKTGQVLHEYYVVDVYVGNVKFELPCVYSFNESARVVSVYATEKLRNHCFFKACTTALEMCNYLIYYNDGSAYDTLFAKISKGKLLYESEDNALKVFERKEGILAEVSYGFFPKGLAQLVFLDSPLIRENLEKIYLITSKFIGTHEEFELNKKFYDYVKECKSLSEKDKEIILRWPPDVFRLIILTEPKKTNDSLVFSVGDFEVKLPSRLAKWLSEVKAKFGVEVEVESQSKAKKVLPYPIGGSLKKP